MNTDQLQQFVKADHSPVSIKNPIDQHHLMIHIGRICNYVIHDGVYIPPNSLSIRSKSILKNLFKKNFIIERDWGANLVYKTGPKTWT